MDRPEDPRLAATREQALDAALELLQTHGLRAVTHGAVSKATGIARSTLYRHWPEVEGLRNDAFGRAARSAPTAPRTAGPLRADLEWLLGFLVRALNDAPWGRIAPQVIAAAATDEDARATMQSFIEARVAGVTAIFDAARARGELRADAPVDDLVLMAISVPYFRKLVAGLPIDEAWLSGHVDLVCRLATAPPLSSASSAR